jgi:hypothetical protein
MLIIGTHTPACAARTLIFFVSLWPWWAVDGKLGRLRPMPRWGGAGCSTTWWCEKSTWTRRQYAAWSPSMYRGAPVPGDVAYVSAWRFTSVSASVSRTGGVAGRSGDIVEIDRRGRFASCTLRCKRPAIAPGKALVTTLEDTSTSQTARAVLGRIPAAGVGGRVPFKGACHLSDEHLEQHAAHKGATPSVP